MTEKPPSTIPLGNAKLIERFFKEMGIELVTATGAKKRGHVVKLRARPVGSRYFGAPISASAALYVFGVHTSPKK